MSDRIDEPDEAPRRDDEEELERPGERPFNVGLIVGIAVVAAVGMALVGIAVFWFVLRPDFEASFPTQVRGRMRGFEARAEMRNLESAIDAYRMRNERLPATLYTLTAADGDNPQPYLAEIPDDPWGQDYEYRLLSRTAYELRCYGADQLPDTEDDIVVRSE